MRGSFRSLRTWIVKNYLPFCFLIAFIIAMSWPFPGTQLMKPTVAKVRVIPFLNMCTVFLISGLTLRTSEIKAAFSRHAIAGSVFGFLSIIGISPLLGFALRELQLHPPEYTMGLVIFVIVPTTLGVGVSLVTSAKGNVGHALFLTIVTNVIGVVFIPLWLRAIFSGQKTAGGYHDMKIDFIPIFIKLLLSNLVPTIIGKVCRDTSHRIENYVQQHKILLSIISNTSLAIVIWQTLSSARDQICATSFGTMLLLLLITLTIHAFYLAFNSISVYILRVQFNEAISTVIMASQKSAPVAITVIAYMTPDASTQGLLAVPCIIGQLLQIFMDQALANFLADHHPPSVNENNNGDLPSPSEPQDHVPAMIGYRDADEEK